jgi:hypothetical protein
VRTQALHRAYTPLTGTPVRQFNCVSQVSGRIACSTVLVVPDELSVDVHGGDVIHDARDLLGRVLQHVAQQSSFAYFVHRSIASIGNSDAQPRRVAQSGFLGNLPPAPKKPLSMVTGVRRGTDESAITVRLLLLKTRDNLPSVVSTVSLNDGTRLAN